MSDDLSRFLAPELLPQLGHAVTVIGADWRYLYVSPTAAEIIGRPAHECVGAHVWDLFPEVLGTPQHGAMVRAMEQRSRETFTWWFESVSRWYEQHALPVADGLLVYVLDITDRMEEVSRAQHLAAAGEALAMAASLEQVNEALARHVHRLVGAAGGSIILADDERGVMRALGWSATGDRAVEGWTEFPAHVATPSAQAHRTGVPVFVEGVDQVRAGFPPIVEQLQRVGADAVAALPLVSANVRLGAWSLIFPPGRRLTDGDRRFLTTVAAMVAQALLRARLLNAEQRAMAQLQHSLLPSRVAATPGLDVAVRYAAGDAAVEVGGDWYDVVPLGDDAVALVMGDVEGHDVEAAACMGLVRSAVRAYAAEGHPPAVVLQLANAFVHDIELDRLVTLVYAVVHPVDRLVTTVSAGHLPLQVVSTTGEHRAVPFEVGPPLGVHAAGAHWDETTSELPRDGLLAAFTDGLVETRSEDISLGLERMRLTLIRVAAEPPEAVADALLAGRSSRSGDDVALLVGRLTAPAPSGRRSRRRMPPTSASVFLARRSTRQLLELWDVPPAVSDAAELVVSELMTNAARQSEDPVEVVVSCSDRAVRIEVADSSHRMPALPVEDVDAEATSGRGLLLVEALATRWGVQEEGFGKRVWADLDLP